MAKIKFLVWLNSKAEISLILNHQQKKRQDNSSSILINNEPSFKEVGGHSVADVVEEFTTGVLHELFDVEIALV